MVRQPNWGFQGQRLMQKSGDWESTNIGSKFLSLLTEQQLLKTEASPALPSRINPMSCEWPSRCIRKGVPLTRDA
jgi:hypothetical protein